MFKVNNNTVCSSNVSCTYDESLISTRNSMTISGHIAYCQPHPVLAIAYNGLDNGGQLRLKNDSQGYCQASIQQTVPVITDFSALFKVVDNGITYELAYWKTGKLIV